MNEYLKALIEIKKIDENKASLDGIFSSANEDRHGDIVMQNFDLKAFKKNPVILNSHDHGDATEVIGKASGVKVKDGKLQGKITFAVNENPKAKIIFDLYKGGFLNAFSVGFIPKEFDDKKNIIKSELLEVSAVSVPANADALVQAKAKGIDVDKLYDRKNSKSKKNDGEGTSQKGDNNKSKRNKNESNTGETKRNKRRQRTIFYKKKEFENYDENNEEIRIKIRDIAEFEDGSFKKTKIKTTVPKIEAMVATLHGDNKKSVQMLFFPKAEGWTTDDARKWLTTEQSNVIGTGTADSQSISSGKSFTRKDRVLKVIKEQNNKKTKAYNKIYKAINLIGESEKKVETRSKSEIAEKKRLVNKSLRKLINIKKEL